MNLSKRVSLIDVSGIRKVFELAAKLPDPINLSIGQPDFDVPESIKEEACSRIKEGFNRYSPSSGIPELREYLMNHFNQKNLHQEDIMITSGVSGGILLAVLSLLNPDDEVLVTDPYFVMYKELPKLIDARISFLDTYPDFFLSAENIEKAITNKTKLLFLNNPGNPTGRIQTKETLSQIAKVLEGTGIWVISDEIYDFFDYENKHRFFASFYEKTITLGGFSKTFGMTGWRMGYALGPKEAIQAMVKLQQYTFVCPPSFAQYACIGAFEKVDASLKEKYREKRNFVFNSLKKTYQFSKPDGAFYCFIKHPFLDGDILVQKALEKQLLLIPGSVFSEKKSHFRLSFAASDSALEKGMQILNDIGNPNFR